MIPAVQGCVGGYALLPWMQRDTKSETLSQVSLSWAPNDQGLTPVRTNNSDHIEIIAVGGFGW